MDLWRREEKRGEERRREEKRGEERRREEKTSNAAGTKANL
jgi:hypothetical protein